MVGGLDGWSEVTGWKFEMEKSRRQDELDQQVEREKKVGDEDVKYVG
jgi:hypothetical protein